eukprot:3539573-Pleurochrysis_carterae.AAC.1
MTKHARRNDEARMQGGRARAENRAPRCLDLGGVSSIVKPMSFRPGLADDSPLEDQPHATRPVICSSSRLASEDVQPKRRGIAASDDGVPLVTVPLLCATRNVTITVCLFDGAFAGSHKRLALTKLEESRPTGRGADMCCRCALDRVGRVACAVDPPGSGRMAPELKRRSSTCVQTVCPKRRVDEAPVRARVTSA